VSDRGRGRAGDRTPLVLIVILVYAAFLVTALASVMIFFPQVSLPGLPRQAVRVTTVAPRPATPAQPAAVRPAARPPQPAPQAETGWTGRVSAAVMALEWPDVGGFARDTWSAAGEWLRGLRLPRIALLDKLRSAPPSPEAPAAAPVAAAPRPVDGATRIERAADDIEAAAARLEGLLQGKPAQAAPPIVAGGPALARPAADAETLRLAYEARLREAEERHAREMAALRASLAGKLTSDEVIKRYNPVIDQGPAAAMLSRPVDKSLFATAVTAPWSEVLATEGIASRQDYDRLRARAEELDTLTARLLEVPYTNSVPPALERIRDAGQTLAREYGRIWTGLVTRLQTRDGHIATLQGQVERYELAMDQLSRDTRESGYVIDPRDPRAILLYVSRLHSPRIGDTIYVFRREDELLATLRVTAVGDTITAVLVNQAEKNKPIAAFDRILVAAAEENKG
jgi:hypothetical protein